MTTTRYEYLDITKGFGILAVVWAHIMLTGITHEICYAFHMPLFFLVSGMLFKREKYVSFLDFVKHRGKRLFVPYVLYSVFTWIIWALFRFVRGDVVDSYWMPLLQTVIAQGSGAFMVHNSALWFIPCLFAVDIMWFFIGKLTDGWAVLISFILCGTSFLFGELFGDNWWFLMPWNFDAALIALPFYGVGNVFVRRLPPNKMFQWVNGHKIAVVFLWAVLTALLVLGTIRFDVCSMGSSSYNCSGWMFVLRAFCGCASILCFSLLLDTTGKTVVIYQKLLHSIKWMGRNSLDVMCTHIPIKGVLVIIVGVLFKVGSSIIPYSLTLSFVVFVATLMAVVVVVHLVNLVFRRKGIR